MDVVAGYVELGLRLGRHIDGLVDAYYGPSQIADQVSSEPLADPASLVAAARRLRSDLTDGRLEEGRTRWLRAQIVGLETVAQKLAGEDIPYADEVERCYGIRPRRTADDEFAAAHEALDAVLPGEAPLAERYQAWREGSRLARGELVRALESLCADLRERTSDLLGLPAGESAEFDFVTDEPWSAFNYYLGGLRSRVAINLDVAISPALATELVTHEIYPGHHTEHAWKEQELVRERGRLEESILMVGTPQSLISEGIAMLGAEILLGDEVHRVTADHLAALGVDYDPTVGRAVARAREPLARVAANAAIMLHEDGASREEARAYLMRWGLTSAERAEHNVRFATDPVWRSYVSTYTDGHDACRSWVRGDPARFKRLLTEQLTPGELLADAA